MRRFARDNGLSLFFGVIFLLALAGQSLVGQAEYNDEQRAEGREAVSYGEYVTSSDFAVDVTENWQSEYLQFLLFISATVWLVQRGSPESKPVGEDGAESDDEAKVEPLPPHSEGPLGSWAKADSPRWAGAGGLGRALYSRSLVIVMGALFLASWTVQSIAGWSAFNSQQLAQRQDTVSWFGYLVSSDFWSRTLQNWQSEFLAVGSMVVFSIFLRQRGSPESKPVGAPHEATGTTN
jgi:hypothetical protein